MFWSCFLKSTKEDYVSRIGKTGRKRDKWIFVLVLEWHYVVMRPETSKKRDVSEAVSEENDVALRHLKFLSSGYIPKTSRFLNASGLRQFYTTSNTKTMAHCQVSRSFSQCFPVMAT